MTTKELLTKSTTKLMLHPDGEQAIVIAASGHGSPLVVTMDVVDDYMKDSNKWIGEVPK